MLHKRNRSLKHELGSGRDVRTGDPTVLDTEAQGGQPVHLVRPCVKMKQARRKERRREERGGKGKKGRGERKKGRKRREGIGREGKERRSALVM